MSTLLELDEVTAGYKGRPVINSISLAVDAGSVTTILGPNGHGKTTLLRAISGLVSVIAGEVRFDGASITRLPVDRIVAAGIVHIPQGDLLFPDMTVRDNLLMGAYLPAANTRAREHMEQVFALLPRLAERQGQVASTLSGGERRMLSIGRGLMSGGRLLLVDEPSLGLAPIVIDQIYEIIANLKRAGHTLLIVEENASRASGLADRVELLDNGRIIWRGAPAELAMRPEIVETYLGG
jgi:branched-chain amino acid transport system ATP-binding protein